LIIILFFCSAELQPSSIEVSSGMASLSLTTLFAVLSWGTARASATNVSYYPALDPQLTSKFSNDDGSVLGYNGSQGVSSINTLSPIPDSLPALTYVSSKSA
jgi:hypothetical protein